MVNFFLLFLFEFVLTFLIEVKNSCFTLYKPEFDSSIGFILLITNIINKEKWFFNKLSNK